MGYIVLLARSWDKIQKNINLKIKQFLLNKLDLKVMYISNDYKRKDIYEIVNILDKRIQTLKKSNDVLQYKMKKLLRKKK